MSADENCAGSDVQQHKKRNRQLEGKEQREQRYGNDPGTESGKPENHIGRNDDDTCGG
jgi:hypothetical protein